MMNAETYCEHFLEKVFYFSLRKTGNEHDAEELAGEIGVEVLTALSRGIKPQSFQAWVWKIARNRWARWAKARYGERALGLDAAGMLEAEDDVELSAADADDKRRMYEALAFTHSEYRTILVAHYFQEKSVSTIARELGLPLGTVKTRLIRSRRELKEGMDMAREFGKRSFAPDDIDFINTCSHFGTSGQPWTILEHLLYKNIFLETYNNPETAEELSLELGVALPYMEAELEFLTRETFMSKENGRYQTDFPIIGKEAQEDFAKHFERIVPELTKLMTEEIDLYAAACERLGEPVQGPWQSYEDAKWMLLMRAVDIHRWAVSENKGYAHTKRPDGGEWDIVGFEKVDRKMPQTVGQHGGYLVAQEQLPFVPFSAFRFNFRGIRYRTQNWYEHGEIYALKMVCEGKAAECEPERLHKLEEYGLIRKEGESWVPTIAVFQHGGENTRFGRFTRQESEAIHEKARRIEALLKEACAIWEKVMEDEMPKRFRKDPRIREMITDVAVNDRGYVLEQAFQDGWLRDDEHTGKGLGAWINL